MTPDRQRKAAERARKKGRGLVAVTVWVRPEHRRKVQEFAGSLQAQRQPAADQLVSAQVLEVGAEHITMALRIADPP